MKEIRKIIRAYDDWLQQADPMALATVVKVEESSYRRIGARMLVAASGLFVGGISGGCLEGDALKKAKYAILRKTPSKVVYDTLEGDDYQIGVGLGCNGRIEILFTPIDPADPANPIALLRKIIEANRPAILLQLISAVENSSLGMSHLLLHTATASPLPFSKVSGTAIQKAVAEVLERRQARTFNFPRAAEEILVEYLRPETRLLIVGNNYDVNAMLEVAAVLGWQVSVMAKKEKVQKSIARQVKKVFDYSEVSSIPLDEYTAVVLMTHDYDWDLKMLPHFIGTGIPYLGLLGPRKRFDKLNAELQEQGLCNDLAEIAYLHGPVGLDIGAESPEEIALAIAAEILSVFRKRDGRQLKYRTGTIHVREA